MQDVEKLEGEAGISLWKYIVTSVLHFALFFYIVSLYFIYLFLFLFLCLLYDTNLSPTISFYFSTHIIEGSIS